MRALISVYDKSGLEEFARSIVELGWEIVSSGGTSSALATAGIAHLEVETVTGAPEMLSGRVKTLHPKIHGGILADRSKPEHLQDLSTQGVEAIDMVVCNLYPFTSNPSIELIDIGGPTMVRAAAKNSASVGILTSPGQYAAVLAELRSSGALSDATRHSLAAAAFAHTAEYDAAIRDWFASRPASKEAESQSQPSGLPDHIKLDLVKVQTLRYGENPHQQGARYRAKGQSGWWDSAEQLGGKELSYLNLFDTEAAWRLVHDLTDEPAVAIIKHATPCGVAIGASIAEAYVAANACDPTSAFGGVVAANRIVDDEMAAALAEVFTEVVVAPGFTDTAIDVLGRKKNLRLLAAQGPLRSELDMRSIDGGLLIQQADPVGQDQHQWRVVTKATPSEALLKEIDFAWRVCAHVKSNAIVISALGRQAVGIGAGQQSRVDAARIAVQKAAGRASGGVCASDAFFPFPDGLLVAAESGISAVIQPGGSVRDAEVIAAADEAGLVMVFSGSRHFRH